VFSLVNSAANVALPAFAAKRRAAARAEAPLLLGVRRCRSMPIVRTVQKVKDCGVLISLS